VIPSTLIILLGALLCGVGGWLYFRYYEMPRPPIGVFNISDVIFTFVFIIIIPLLYILLPTWAIMGMLLLATFSLIYFALEPVLPQLFVWLITILVVGADLALGFTRGTTDPAYLAVNNGLIVISVISIANAWAGSGMKVRDAAILGGLLIFYDFIATTQLSLMGDLFSRLGALPLSPMIAWGQGETFAAIGLGDLLMMTVFPLTLWKGYGLQAGLIALGIGMLVVVVLVITPISHLFPVMVVLGPLMVGQYLWWRRSGQERRWKEFRPYPSKTNAR
jgi:hypothetical protein